MAIELGDAIWRINGDDSPLRKTLAESSTAIGLAFTAAGAAITATLGKAAFDAATFGQAMANVSTLGVADLGALDKGVREVATSFGLDLNDAAKTLYDTISAGIPEDAAVMVMGAAAKGAQAGVGSLAEAMDLGTSALNAWDMKGKDANETTANMEKIMGQAATAIKAGKTTIADMAGAIGQVAPVMAAGNVKTEEFFAALAALTATGQPTSSAMAALRQVIAGVIKPTAEATKLAKKLGIEFSIAAIKSKGFDGFLADIQEKTGGNVELMGELFGSVEALGAVISLTGNQAGKFAETLKDMAGAQDNLNTMSAEFIRNNPEMAFAQLKSEMQNLSIVVGRAVLPSLIQLLDIVKPIVQGIASWIENNAQLGASIAALVGGFGLVASVVGPLILGFSGISTLAGVVGAVFSSLSVPVLAVAAALGVGAYALYDYFQAWGGWQALWAWIGSTIDGARAWISANMEQIKSIMGIGHDILIEIANALGRGLQTAFNIIKTAFNNFVNFVGPTMTRAEAITWDNSKSILDNVEQLATGVADSLNSLNMALDAFLDKVDAFWARFAWLTDMGTSRIGNLIAGFWDMVGPLLTWNPVRDWLFSAPDTGTTPTAMATGGHVTGAGWAMVGERGPELVQLPRGATVYDAGQTARAQQMGGNSITINVGSVRNDDDIREIERALTRVVNGGLLAAGYAI